MGDINLWVDKFIIWRIIWLCDVLFIVILIFFFFRNLSNNKIIEIVVDVFSGLIFLNLL